MKQELSPAVVAGALAAVVAVVGFLLWWTSRPGKQAAEIEKAIQGSTMKAPGPGNGPGPAAPGPAAK